MKREGLEIFGDKKNKTLWGRRQGRSERYLDGSVQEFKEKLLKKSHRIVIGGV